MSNKNKRLVLCVLHLSVYFNITENLHILSSIFSAGKLFEGSIRYILKSDRIN